MDAFRIEGGRPLGGTLTASGNKNAALPLAAMSMMLNGPLELTNVPRIGDVNRMFAILREMGAAVEDTGPNATRVDTSGITAEAAKANLADSVQARKLRGSILFAAPNLVRFGEVEIPFPGGDRIGRRRMDTHLMVFELLGAQVDLTRKGVRIRAPKGLFGTDILLDEASVTGTENAVMAAACAKGSTIIRNAACEPHVQQVCRGLVAAGAKIRGIGTNTLEIDGVDQLGGATLRIGADYIEVASYLILAAVTGGELTIREADPDNLRMAFFHFGRLGIYPEVRGNDIYLGANQKLIVQEDARGAVPKIEDAPWPGFPADMTSITLVAATQARGSVLIFEKMFESRLFFTDQLIEMGAKIVLCDPHRVVTIGPSPLVGAPISSPDIRAGMALLIAALAAKGESVMRNIEQIDRGYEHIDERLRSLGARIERIDI